MDAGAAGGAAPRRRPAGMAPGGGAGGAPARGAARLGGAARPARRAAAPQRHPVPGGSGLGPPRARRGPARRRAAAHGRTCWRPATWCWWRSLPATAAAPGPNRPARPERLALRQIPAVEGAVVALDPATGRVLAMAGGWSFEKSQFNRTTQAMRQPGSSFKPFVYLPALEMGIPPNQRFLDGPIEINDAAGRVAADQLQRRRQRLRHHPHRAGEVAQPRHRPRRAGSGHGQGVGRGGALRRHRQDAALPRQRRSAPARRRCCAWPPATPPSSMAGAR